MDVILNLIIVSAAFAQGTEASSGNTSEIVSMNIIQVASIGLNDICRWTVRQDTLYVRAVFLFTEGSDFERWLGVEDRMFYDLLVPVVVRTGVDLTTEKQRVFLQGDSLTLSIPYPTVFGSTISAEGTGILAMSTGSFLSSPYSLHDEVLRNLDSVIYEHLQSELEAILMDCREETEESLMEFTGGLCGVQHIQIEWR